MIARSISHWGILVDGIDNFLCMDDWCDAKGDSLQVFTEMMSSSNDIIDEFLDDEDVIRTYDPLIPISVPFPPFRTSLPPLRFVPFGGGTKYARCGIADASGFSCCGCNPCRRQRPPPTPA